jgi:hypoxanthine-DNA glycosylase
MIAMTPSPASKSCFPPVVDARTRLLLLGSLPGEASLARGQYYAHPQNQFWRLMAAVIGRDLASLPYLERLAALNDAGVGLWDVVGRARRVGSLDAAIRDVEPSALADLIATLPALRGVAFNGAKAAAVGRGLLGAGATHVVLPSSSPAHTMAFAQKAVEWTKLRAFLDAS